MAFLVANQEKMESNPLSDSENIHQKL